MNLLFNFTVDKAKKTIHMTREFASISPMAFH